MKWVKIVRLIGEILIALAAGFSGSYLNATM